MAEEKNLPSSHDEISTVAPGQVQQHHLDIDQEISRYVGHETVQVDEETSKKLFWTVNKRILACMLGVSAVYVAADSQLTICRHTFASHLTKAPWASAQSWESRRTHTSPDRTLVHHFLFSN